MRQNFKEYHTSLAIDEADLVIWLLMKRQLIIWLLMVLGSITLLLLSKRQTGYHTSVAIDEADIRHSFVVETVRYLVVDVVNVV